MKSFTPREIRWLGRGEILGYLILAWWDLEVLWREREVYVAQVMALSGGVSDYAETPIPGAIVDSP
ncbi:MAG: hypothetical protein ABIZ70_12065 [Gemmatimonadales bacterium]